MSDLETEMEFTAAIDRYGGLISKICYYFSTDTEEFNDLRQEVLYNIWKGWTKFRQDSKLSTWIYRISFNTCVSFQRKEKRKSNLISIDEVVNLAAEQDSSLLERYNKMHALIQKLGYEERAIILLWLDEKSYEEIAEVMGKPRNTIAVRIMRIKEKLVKMSKEE